MNESDVEEEQRAAPPSARHDADSGPAAPPPAHAAIGDRDVPEPSKIPAVAVVVDDKQPPDGRKDAPQDKPVVERLDDDVGPHPPASTSMGPLKKSDLVKQIRLQNGPEMVDYKNPTCAATAGSPQDVSIAKKIARLEAPTDSEDFEPPAPLESAEDEDEDATKMREYVLLDKESIVVCKSKESGTWFVREHSRVSAGSRPSRRARAWGGRWLPVVPRQNAGVESWQRLKGFNFYSIPTSEGMETALEYANDHDAMAMEADEESPQTGAGIFIHEGEDEPRADRADAGRPLLGQGASDSMPVIPNAVLVEDDDDVDIIDAEPLLPWWKQTRIVLSVVCLMWVAAAIAVVITYLVGEATLLFAGTGASRIEFRSSPPSSSLAPSSSPAPSSSRAPSASPTTCYWIEIEVASFDNDRPIEQAWKISRIDDDGDIDEIKSHDDDGGDASRIESTCLPRGEYEFTITFEPKKESEGIGGTCCKGQYSITSGGQLIVQGNEVWQQYLAATSRFSIPYLSSMSSRVPMIVGAPSQRPSSVPS